MTLGVVVIGRNEGERLGACLRSVVGQATTVVYVDSGSTDGSVMLAHTIGAEVVSLDLSRPFTAARARNVGFARLKAVTAEISRVQFVDGDCEVQEGWLDKGARFLESHPEVAAVCGRNRERYPDRSVYNQLCDLEWNTPVGSALACGGIAMYRREALEQAKGFREDLIAGEEPELCVRLRGLGWKIWRLDAEMTLHDAAMTRFSQWWRRSVRTGHAFAEGAHLHGARPERHWVRETRGARIWALAVPLVIVVGVVFWSPLAALGVLVYPIQVVRLALREGGATQHRWVRAFFLVLGKFPELLGQWKYIRSRWARRLPQLIEYK